MIERLGKYRITGVLGEGAMGIVYQGFDPGIQRVVAIKTMRRQLLGTDQLGSSALQRFRNEAQAAGRLSHPGIVAVYDFGEDATEQGELAYIAMEFVQGQTLERYLANQVHFNEGDIVSVLAQLLDALDHAHRQGVWHRDIKPANVLLTRDGRVKLADFGIARIDSVAMTQVGGMIGTPSYMAPEQFLGTPIDQRVDIYACGVLLYLLLTGQPPFKGSAESLMYRVVHEPPVLPTALPGYAGPAHYDAWVARALAKQAADRFGSALEFKQALLATLGDSADAVSDATVIALPVKSDGRHPPAPGTRSGPAWSSAAAPTGWTSEQLSRLEATLARHVGPLAAVLVRRTARECTDLPTLAGKLATHVTEPRAREAFLAEVAMARPGQPERTAGSSAPGKGHPGTEGDLAVLQSPTVLSEQTIAQAQRLLMTQLGPIASVVVRRALARSPARASFFGVLVEAVPAGPERERLRTELERLP
jgi:serine/threonine-protein kinase